MHVVGLVAADLLDLLALRLGQVLVPADLLQHAVAERRMAVLDLGADRIRAFGEQVHAVALVAPQRAEVEAAVAHRLGRVVEVGRAGMLVLRRAPARPRQAVVVAVARAAVGLERHRVEGVLVLHVQLQALRRLARVADRQRAAVELARHVLRQHAALVVDLDVLEHLLLEAELLGEQIHDLVIGLGLEERPEDLLAPLQRAVRRGERAVRLEGRRPAAGRRRPCGRASPRPVGCGSTTTSRSSFSNAFLRSGPRVCELARGPRRPWPSGCRAARRSPWPRARRRPSATAGCRPPPSASCPGSAPPCSRRTRPRRATSASRRLRPGRSSPAG